MALAEEDRHGYAIIQDVAERTDGALRLSAGTLYRSIQRLLEQGRSLNRVSGAPEEDDERRRTTASLRGHRRGKLRRRLTDLVRWPCRGLAPGEVCARIVFCCFSIPSPFARVRRRGAPFSAAGAGTSPMCSALLLSASIRRRSLTRAGVHWTPEKRSSLHAADAGHSKVSRSRRFSASSGRRRDDVAFR